MNYESYRGATEPSYIYGGNHRIKNILNILSITTRCVSIQTLGGPNNLIVF